MKLRYQAKERPQAVTCFCTLVRDGPLAKYKHGCTLGEFGTQPNVRGSVHHSINHREITNKIKPCTRIYYSSVYQLLNMFRATHRSSSGSKNCNCSLWFYIRLWGGRPLSRLSLGSGRHPQTCVKPEAAITVFEILMMCGVSPETC